VVVVLVAVAGVVVTVVAVSVCVVVAVTVAGVVVVAVVLAGSPPPVPHPAAITRSVTANATSTARRQLIERSFGQDPEKYLGGLYWDDRQSADRSNAAQDCQVRRSDTGVARVVGQRVRDSSGRQSR